MCGSALASGPCGADAVRPLVESVLGALQEGRRERGGPLPAGGPAVVAARVARALDEVLPEEGDPGALGELVRVLAAGAADPADPWCAAHLHCPPLAVAVAADLAVSVLNPSLDSWDQAPSASALEGVVTRALAREAGMAEALVTSGGTEANQLAVLLAREACGPGCGWCAGRTRTIRCRGRRGCSGFRSRWWCRRPAGCWGPRCWRGCCRK